MERSDFSLSVPGDVCAPAGFRAAGLHCGLKREKPDLALLYSQEPETTAAAVFTTNRVKAAPVRYSAEVVAKGRARAVVANSGNANACTGAQGMRDAREMARLAADALSLDPGEVLVASTGIIGVPLRMDPLREGIPRAARELSPVGDAAARAIMTTDRFPKTASAHFDLGGGRITVGGMAKGAGMIHPKMATTLCFLTTDARIDADSLQRALRTTADRSFNRITVDGETSTNDTIFLLASGAADAPRVEGEEALARFTDALSGVAESLARMVPRDGEGATRLIQVRIDGARDDADARAGAYRVANSLLVKTALRGGDPNWGRIMAALGDAGIEIDEEKTDIWLDDLQLVRDGLGISGSVEAGRKLLQEEGREEAVELKIGLGLGSGSASVWTCDLGEEYVRINVAYN